MAIAGGWRAASTIEPYAAANQWGNGINPVHAVPAGIPRGGPKLPLGSTGPGDMPPEILLGPAAWGYQAEDASLYVGEDYRYLAEDHPNWGQGITGRPDRDGDIMTVGAYPQPEGWPAWGPYNDDNPVDGFPLSGPPGGAGVRANSDQLELERGRAISVPTPGYTGGWQSKVHGNVNEARTSDPSQYEVATGLRQLHSRLDNGRAVARGTDDPREPIGNRLTGVKVRLWARSWGMGGGAGTPDMFPQQLDTVPKRPWFYRTGATPPPEQHTWNEITYFEALQRTPPDDAGASVTTQAAQGQAAPDYGYTDDGSWF